MCCNTNGDECNNVWRARSGMNAIVELDGLIIYRMFTHGMGRQGTHLSANKGLFVTSFVKIYSAVYACLLRSFIDFSGTC